MIIGLLLHILKFIRKMIGRLQLKIYSVRWRRRFTPVKDFLSFALAALGVGCRHRPAVGIDGWRYPLCFHSRPGLPLSQYQNGVYVFREAAISERASSSERKGEGGYNCHISQPAAKQHLACFLF